MMGTTYKIFMLLASANTRYKHANVVQMSPQEYLHLALPFGWLGGPKLDQKKVDMLTKSKTAWPNPMLSIKENSNGELQVGPHDDDHRAMASKARGDKLIDVDIVRGRKFARENPSVSDEDMAKRVANENVLPENNS